MNRDKVEIQTRFPKEIAQKIKEMAAKDRRSVSSMVVILVLKGMSR